MASRNRNWVAEFSSRYNVKVQQIKGDDKTISVALLNGKQHNGLGQLNKAQTEDLFKNISQGVENTLVNNTTVCKNTIYLNGNKYDIMEVVRGIQVDKLIEIMDNGKRNQIYYNIGKWLLDAENRRKYISSLHFNRLGDAFYFSGVLKLYLDTGKIERPTGALARTILDEMKIVLGG